MDCVICGKRGTDLYLAGDYKTTLCHGHSNEWREYCAELDEFLQASVLLETKDHAMVMGTDAEVREIMQQILEAHLAMYHRAKEWTESQINC